MSVKLVLRRVAISLAGLLVLGYVGLFLFQDLIIFQSVRLGKDFKFEFDVRFDEHFIPVSRIGHDTLNALWFKSSDATFRGLILYFHGNRGNLQRWGRYAADLTRFGYDVLVIDYRGYGKSTGKPGEAVLYSDAREVYDWAKKQIGDTPIVIYGRSLGSAVASNLAILTKPPLLILETPFDEIRGAIPPYWKPLNSLLPLKYTFSNYEHLKAANCRTIIFHGTNDKIVPLSSALRLKEFVVPEDFVILEGGTHRNLSTFPAYRQKLQKHLVLLFRYL